MSSFDVIVIGGKVYVQSDLSWATSLQAKYFVGGVIIPFLKSGFAKFHCNTI